MFEKLLAICMIVKNRKPFLELNLPVFAKIADELVIVDTGSNKDTLDFCRKNATRIYEQAWENDFSKPRNLSLKKARANWLLVLDSDEFVSEELLVKLKALLAENELPNDVYAVPVYNNKVGSFNINAQFTLKQRLIRNHKGIHFTGKILESLVDKQNKHIENVFVIEDFHVMHWGVPDNLAKEDWASKKERNIFILRQEVEEASTDIEKNRYLYQLAVNYFEKGEQEKAVALLSELINKKEVCQNKYFYLDIGVKLARYLLIMGKLVQGEKVALEVLERDRNRAELWNTLGLISLGRKEWDKALGFFKESIKTHLPQNAGADYLVAEYTYLNRFYLGFTCFFKGEPAEAKKWFEESIARGANKSTKAKIENIMEGR
jgi:glycosyltransferase involved in cell wall biosynthesis